VMQWMKRKDEKRKTIEENEINWTRNAKGI
jgi:hypothetical protein